MQENTSVSHFSREDFILRDYLAADRTILANERTFLAYVRTALTAIVVGVSFIKFFESTFIERVGWIILIGSVILFIMGLMRYRQIKQLILKAEKDIV